MKNKKMKSAGGIVFYNESGKTKYLLLKHKKTGSHWGFPKGRMEENESEKETASREIREETGIEEFEILDLFKEIENYSFIRENTKINKQVSYFLVRVNSTDVGLSEEHTEFCWVDFSEAIRMLKNNETKEILDKAHKILK